MPSGRPVSKAGQPFNKKQYHLQPSANKQSNLSVRTPL